MFLYLIAYCQETLHISKLKVGLLRQWIVLQEPVQITATWCTNSIQIHANQWLY